MTSNDHRFTRACFAVLLLAGELLACSSDEGRARRETPADAASAAGDAAGGASGASGDARPGSIDVSAVADAADDNPTPAPLGQVTLPKCGVGPKLQYWYVSVVYSADGTKLYAGREDGIVDVFSTSDWTLIDRLPFRPKVAGLGVSRDGRYLGVGLPDTVELVRLADRTRLRVFAAPDARPADGVHTVSLSSDGRYLMASGRQCTLSAVYLWETASGRLIHRFDGSYGSISDDGGTIVINTHVAGVYRADGVILEVLGKLQSTAAVSSDGKRIAVHSEGKIRMLDAVNHTELWVNGGPGRGIRFSPDETRLLLFAPEAGRSDISMKSGLYLYQNYAVDDFDTGDTAITNDCEASSIAVALDNKTVAAAGRRGLQVAGARSSKLLLEGRLPVVCE